MTTPYERTRSLIQTKAFLEALLNPKQTPRAPQAVREEARRLLRHYPGYAEIELAHQELPDWYGPVPPFSRMSGDPQTVGVIEATKANDK